MGSLWYFLGVTTRAGHYCEKIKNEEVKQIKFNTDKNEEYEVELIQDNMVYARELKLGYHLPKLYYLVL